MGTEAEGTRQVKTWRICDESGVGADFAIVSSDGEKLDLPIRNVTIYMEAGEVNHATLTIFPVKIDVVVGKIVSEFVCPQCGDLVHECDAK